MKICKRFELINGSLQYYYSTTLSVTFEPFFIGKLRLCREERERIIKEHTRTKGDAVGDFPQEKTSRTTSKHIQGTVCHFARSPNLNFDLIISIFAKVN